MAGKKISKKTMAGIAGVLAVLFASYGLVSVTDTGDHTYEVNITVNETRPVSRCDVYSGGGISCYQTTETIQVNKTINVTVKPND
jgi:hypothetical protein